jgi:hypothetical protein
MHEMVWFASMVGNLVGPRQKRIRIPTSPQRKNGVVIFFHPVKFIVREPASY